MEKYLEEEDEEYDYKEEAEKIKKSRGFLAECFYTSYVNKWEEKLSVYFNI